MLNTPCIGLKKRLSSRRTNGTGFCPRSNTLKTCITMMRHWNIKSKSEVTLQVLGTYRATTGQIQVMKKAPMYRLPCITTSVLSQRPTDLFLAVRVLGSISSERDNPLSSTPATLTLSVSIGSTFSDLGRAVIAVKGVTSTENATFRFVCLPDVEDRLDSSCSLALTFLTSNAYGSSAVPALEAGALLLHEPTDRVEEPTDRDEKAKAVPSSSAQYISQNSSLLVVHVICV